MRGHFRKRRIKSGVVFSILGIVLMVATLAAIYFWETKGREHFLYQRVVVLNQTVEEGIPITAEILSEIKVDPESIIDGAVVRQKEILGKYSDQYIAKNSQLALAYFKDDVQDSKKKDSYIFSIPPEWVISFPSSLRRGDIIYFYPVKAESKKDEEGRPLRNLEVIKTSDTDDLLYAEVAYLKDSGNREVVDIEGGERYDGSSNIASIEIITGFEDISYLQSSAENGYGFIIFYEES